MTQPAPLLKTILFDFGGVLLRTHDPSPRRRWEEKLGLAPGELAAYIFNGPLGRQAQLGRATWQAVWADAARKFGLSAEEAARAQRDFFSGDVLDRDLVAYLRRLKERYTIGLLSNTWHTDGRTLLLQFGIADAFHFTVTSAEVGVMKPDPRIFHIALQRANARPPEALFVDDFEENVLAARKLGMQAVYFVEPETARARLVELTGVS
ncbi:MAG: HAD family phosphatase [Caldilineae bacterium]|nr:MAG: HAD family phosphatase [Caldilineae bacterium]